MNNDRRYAFILPRFGDFVGGAEALVGALARALHARGESLEVWTTCAIDNRSWENHFDEGVSSIDGITVRRFLVDNRDLECWIPKQIAIHEGMKLPLDDELSWMANSVNSEGLYSYIQQEGSSFDALFFAPYLFGTTFWGSLIHPDRSYLIPCLHDETYAYTQVIQSMFRQVAGCVFNAYPEMDLAETLYGPIPGGVVGLGFTPFKESYVSSLPAVIQDPFILYAGRKETGKNVHLLIDYFIQAKEAGKIPAALKLVIIGGGSFDDLHRPGADARDDIVDLGHVTEDEKYALMRDAVYLCQPSVNESFSIVLMEAWLLGTPVVVHGRCPVTRYHVVRSGGGLYFDGMPDFAEVTRVMMEDTQLAQALAAQGECYVREEFSWEAVLQRFDSVMTTLISGKGDERITGTLTN